MNNTLQQYRADQIEQGALWEQLEVKHHWYHVVRGRVMNGEIGRVGVNAWAVYSIVKAHTSLDTGDAWPSIDKIADLCQLSHDTVQRALKRLVEAGMLKIAKRGRHNVYALIEKIDMTHPSGEHFATAQRKYAPMQFGPFVDELKRVAATGNMPSDRAITINVTVNVQNITQRDGGTVSIVQNFQVGSGADSADRAHEAELRERLSRVV